VDQVFPPGVDAYGLLSSGRCAELLAFIDEGGGSNDPDPWLGGVPNQIVYLYHSAGEACLSNWTASEQDFNRIDDNDFSRNCDTAACQQTRQAVYIWTSDLLRDHQADPNFVPDFS